MYRLMKLSVSRWVGGTWAERRKGDAQLAKVGGWVGR